MAYDKEIKENVLAKLFAGAKPSDLAKTYNISKQVISKWKMEALSGKQSDLFFELRQNNNVKIAKRCYGVMGNAVKLQERMINRALTSDSQFQKIIDLVNTDQDISESVRKDILKKLTILKVEDVKSLAVVINTMYDKQVQLMPSSDNSNTGQSIESFLHDNFEDNNVEY